MTTDKKIDALLERSMKMKYQIHASFGALSCAIWTLTALASADSRPIWFIFSTIFALIGAMQYIACSGRLGIGYFFGVQDKDHFNK